MVIDTFFTTCTLICPILGAIFADLQDSWATGSTGRCG